MRWNKKKRHFVPWVVRNPEAYLERWYQEHGLGDVWVFMKMIQDLGERQKIVAQRLATIYNLQRKSNAVLTQILR